MLEWMHDPEIAKAFQLDFLHMTLHDAEQFIADSFSEENRHFAIVDEQDEYQGTISLKHIDQQNKKAEYAIVTRKGIQGKGYAGNATNELIVYAFRELGLHRLYLYVLEDNGRANRFYQKMGFAFEARLVDYVKIHGEYRTQNLYRLLERDWGKGMNISSTAIIHENVTIEEDVIIHDYVVLYPGTVLKRGVEVYDHCVLGKIPKAPAGTTARKIAENFEQTVIGEHTVLSPGCCIYAGTRVGKSTLLGDNCSIREDCVIGDHCIISRNVSVNYNTTIGDRTKIMDNSHITGDAVIEEDVFISVLVSTTNDNTMGRDDYDLDHVRGPHIKRKTTVGAGANILPRVTVGENCIVGAGAVVSRDVPDNKVVMGVPARIVRDLEKK